MPYLALSLRLSVAPVLLAAAAAKLRAGRAARAELGQAIQRLGAPGWMAGPLAAATVAAEFAIAVLLCTPGTALLGCLAAVALLSVFTAGVRRLVAMDAGVACRCFGAPRDLDGGHLVRNVALLFLASAAALATVLAPAGGISPLVLAVATPIAVPIAAAFVRWDDLVILAAGLRVPATDEKGTGK